eukprot:20943-Heterococcus_DN1.PRE.4
MAPPEGFRPIWIQAKNYGIYGLGGGDVPTPNYVVLKKADILADIDKYGFMNDFNDYKIELKKFKGEDLLVVRDPQRLYGEDWYFCYTQQAYDSELQRLQSYATSATADADAEAELAAQQALAEEELLRQQTVYVDVPIQSKQWVTTTLEETCAEVDALTIDNNNIYNTANNKSRRHLLKINMTRPRHTFGQPCHFMDRDAMEWLTDEGIYKMGIKKYMDAAFNPYDVQNPDKKLQDSIAQCSNTTATTASQTTWHRPVNASVQSGTLRHEAQQTATSSTSTDASTSAVSTTAISSDSITSFLRHVRPLVEQALQQNEAVDIYSDVFTTNNGGDENDDPNNSNNSNSLMKQVENAYVLVWDFVDLITPVMKLESPQEVFCFRLNPTQPDIAVGGTLSGQVVLWDMTHALSTLDRRSSKKQKQSTQSTSSTTTTTATTQASSGSAEPLQEHEDGTSTSGSSGSSSGSTKGGCEYVAPTVVSHIDLGHRQWLPPDAHINSRGQLLSVEHRDNQSHQFITIAADGQCLFWDIRYQDIADGMLPYIARPRNTDKKTTATVKTGSTCNDDNSSSKGGKQNSNNKHANASNDKDAPQLQHKALWTPLFRMQ